MDSMEGKVVLDLRGKNVKSVEVKVVLVLHVDSVEMELKVVLDSCKEI